jgi:hypothetical protein
VNNKYVYVSIGANVLLLSVVGYLFNRGPEQVVTKVIEEKVVTKVEVQTVTEYKDKIVYKDRVVIERVTTPDGTVTERTTAESEGSKDSSVSTVENRTESSVTDRSRTTSVVNNPTKLSRYSLGVDYSLKNTVEKKNLTLDWSSVTLQVGARIGNLPLFIGVFSNLSLSEYGLGLRVEF